MISRSSRCTIHRCKEADVPRKSEEFQCESCGESFQSAERKAGRQPRYCSRRCSGLARRRRVSLVCVQCLGSFERKQYMEAWSQDRGPFCGFDCYGAWQRDHTRGEQNPNHKPQSAARAAGQWSRNRLRALERDGHQCCRCGSRHRLHVHHRVPWTPQRQDPHALGNLETLCASCHRQEHPVPRGPDGRFLPSR